jgi:hypothetical protein
MVSSFGMKKPAAIHSRLDRLISSYHSSLVLGLIVLATLGVIVWRLWTPALSFAQGFRSLLERPTGSAGLWPFLKGVETVGGEYAGRPTLLGLTGHPVANSRPR